jgi:hypothetical protein
MSTEALLFLVVRALHVLVAAAWVGVTVFLVFFLMPAVKETGPGAGPIMGALNRRNLNGFIGSIGGLAVLSGFYLYWRFTGHFDPTLSATRTAMVFGTGGIAGTTALILGGAVVGRNARKMSALGPRIASMPEGAERAALAAEMTAARDKAATFARVVLVLQVIALITMAIGHYI